MTARSGIVTRLRIGSMNSTDANRGWTPSPRGTDIATEESALLAAIAEGDPGAPMEEICARYSRRIYALGIQILGDRGMAEELVQDTFVRLWRSAPSYDSSIASPRTFIYTLARRAAVDLQRRPATRPLETEDEPAGRLPDPKIDEKFDQVVLGIDVRDAIETLSEKHRETISLCYDADLTQSQISEKLGIPLGTVKTRIHHALKALKIELEGRDLVV